LSQKRSVPVTIQGRQYRVRADGDATGVQRAAELVDETMAKVRARAGTADSVDIAVLAALNLANALASDRVSEGALQGLAQRIDSLARLVETATADTGPAPS
jgi:cell division protein ZapA